MSAALDAPLLWVLAEEDREAPSAATRRILERLIEAGRPIDVYVFPGADHGMVEFTETADGERPITRITDGYFSLLGDWIKDEALRSYGRGCCLPSGRIP